MLGRAAVLTDGVMANPTLVSTEYGYRSEVGTALERSARLEDENRRLQLELDRLRRAPHANGHAKQPAARGAVLASVLAVAMVALGVAGVVASRRPAVSPHAVTTHAAVNH